MLSNFSQFLDGVTPARSAAPVAPAYTAPVQRAPSRATPSSKIKIYRGTVPSASPTEAAAQ